MARSRKAPSGEVATSNVVTRRRAGEETRQRIMAEATRLFAGSGFAAVSTREIADACEVTVPAIYLYFEDKRQLYLDCVVAVFRRSSEHIGAALDGEESPTDKVRRLVTTLVRSLIEDPYLLNLFQWELATSDMEGLALLEVAAFREIVTRLQATVGEALDRPVPRIDVTAIFGLAFGLVQYRKVGAALDLPQESDPAEFLASYILQKIFPELG